MDEFRLINKISRLLGASRNSRTIIGLGDDVAVIRPDGRRYLLLSVDTINEEIHFRKRFLTPFEAGFKSASGGISDLCAKGGECAFLLVSISVPGATAEGFILEFYRGIKSAARLAGAMVVGGDTTRSARYFSATICAAGYAEKEALKLRSGARPGDRLFVTGQTGYSLAGLRILERGVRRRGRAFRMALQKHRMPLAQVGWGRKKIWIRHVHASIDISDGLSSELHHIARASGVRLVVRLEPMTSDSALHVLAKALHTSARALAMNSGEEYALLLAADRRFRFKGAVEVGWVEKGRAGVFASERGKISPLEPGGWNHFRNK